MKKIFLIAILFLSLILSSCGTMHIEDTNGKDDFTLSTLKEDEIFTYRNSITVGTITKGSGNEFSVSCQKLSGNYLVKKFDTKNRHYTFTIDFKIENGNAYCALIKGDEIVSECEHNKVTNIQIYSDDSDIQLRILGESCKFSLNIVYEISK